MVCEKRKKGTLDVYIEIGTVPQVVKV